MKYLFKTVVAFAINCSVVAALEEKNVLKSNTATKFKLFKQILPIIFKSLAFLKWRLVVVDLLARVRTISSLFNILFSARISQSSPSKSLQYLYRHHLDKNSSGGDGCGDLVAQLSSESAAPEGVEAVLKARDSLGVEQRFAA